MPDTTAVDLRLMVDTDVEAAEDLWRQAWAELDREYDLQGPSPSEADHQRMRDRLRHLRASDPEGSWVAVEDSPGGERVVGIAQAFIRDDLWVLSLLGVAPGRQDRHIGRDLLDRTLEYGDRASPGLILASPDHRAQRRYLRAGFALHPEAVGSGVLDRHRLAAVAADSDLKAVRRGGHDDMGLVDDVSRKLRGARRQPDGDFMLQVGARLYVADDGYAFFGDQSPVVVAAESEATARALVVAGMLETEPATQVRIDWITARQQWAFEAAVDLGLRLQAGGAVMVRGDPGPMSPYLPSGAFA